MTKEKYYAKSTGESLIDHLRQVSEKAEGYAKERFPNNDTIAELARLGGFLHDIGKMSGEFQIYIRGGKSSKNTRYTPHEIISANIVNNITNLDHKKKSALKYIVLWHHGKRHAFDEKKKRELYTEITSISSSIDNNDLSALLSEVGLKVPKKLDVDGDRYVSNFITFESDRDEYNKDLGYFAKADALAALACVIQADWEVSGNKDLFIGAQPELSVAVPEFKDDWSLKQQKTARKISSSQKNNIICSVGTGQGKTAIALLAYIEELQKNPKAKLNFLLPKQILARETYKTLLSDMSRMGLENISIQCFYGGKVQYFKDHTPTESATSASINILVIDRPISSMFYSSRFYELMDVYDSFLVFDEYHEIINEETMIPVTAMIVKVRNHMNRKTLFLSATPSTTLNNLLFENGSTEEMDGDVKINNTHLTIKFVNDLSHIIDINTKKTIIYRSQVNAVIDDYNLYTKEKTLLHGRYGAKDKYEIMTRNVDLFRKSDNMTLFSSPLGVSSINMSAHTMIIETMDMLSIVQAVGRLNRFGKHKDPVLYLLLPNMGTARAKNESKSTALLSEFLQNTFKTETKMTKGEFKKLLYSWSEGEYNKMRTKEVIDGFRDIDATYLYPRKTSTSNSSPLFGSILRGSSFSMAFANNNTIDLDNQVSLDKKDLRDALQHILSLTLKKHRKSLNSVEGFDYDAPSKYNEKILGRRKEAPLLMSHTNGEINEDLTKRIIDSGWQLTYNNTTGLYIKKIRE